MHVDAGYESTCGSASHYMTLINPDIKKKNVEMVKKTTLTLTPVVLSV